MPTLPPLLSSPPPADVAQHGWAAITVRVAWTLLTEGVRVRPTVLRDARDHALFHIAPDLPLPVAEDRAATHVARFVARARRRSVEDPWKQDAEMQFSPRWHRVLEHALTPLTGALFRYHYGDGNSLEQLERTLNVDRIALEAGRGGLREILRRSGCADGLPFDQWPAARLDRMLRRLAAYAPGPCPAPLEVVEGHHRDHVARCPRCDRMYRLIRQEILVPADLVPPLAAARPTSALRVLALHFHPDGRRHREIFAREANLPSFPVGEDLLLLDLQDAEAVQRLMVLAAEVGRPHRDHLRTVALEGPGRWSGHGLLGPLVDRAEMEVRSKPWGVVDGGGELPPPLPPPPSARRWWTGVATLSALCAGLSMAAFAPGGVEAAFPAAVEFTEARGGVWVDFHVDERAHVAIYRVHEGKVEALVEPKVPADKAPLAVGDGSYLVHAAGSAVAVVSSVQPLDSRELLAEATAAEDPMEALAVRVRSLDPGADVHVWRDAR
jgi:hypothetical protein